MAADRPARHGSAADRPAADRPAADGTQADLGDPARFRRVSDQPVFQGHMIRLASIVAEDPTGEQFQRDVVHHPGAVIVVPLDDDGRVHLVRQYRAAVDALVLEAPAGTRDVHGEAPAATARRELVEEAGLEAEQVEQLAACWNSPGYSDQETLIFLATGLRPCPPEPSGPEEHWMTVEPVALEAVPELVAQGHLKDATTILALQLAAARAAP